MEPTLSVNQHEFQKAIQRFRTDPVLFVQTMFKAEPDPRQAAIMNAVASGARGVAAKSGHGVGKTTTLSWLAIWWISVFYKAKAVVTAPTSGQLNDALLPEMKAWIRQMPEDIQELYNIKQDRVELVACPDLNFISAKTSRAEQPDAMQGVHADHVLLIGDEASGIPEQVYEASAGSMSSEHACMLLAGNPVRSSGYFYDIWGKNLDGWEKFTISCVESPRVSRDYIEEAKLRYGEDSNAYRVRVLGEFPRGDDDTVIPIELVQAAEDRDVLPFGNVVWGVDVARFGTDASALCKRRQNAVMEPVRIWRGLDTMQVTGAIVAEWEATDPRLRPLDIMVDSIGLGAGVVDRLRELELPARGINVSESPSMKGQYINLKAELWYRARSWLEARDCRLPKDERLATELVTPRFSFTSSGKVKVEGKDEIRRRGIGSPDAADAFVLTFASNAATALHGRGRKHKGSLKRNISGIV
jgi:phage terminase large subunit